jgi:hypothetical protein
MDSPAVEREPLPGAANPEAYRHRLPASLAILLTFGITLAGLAWQGRQGRVVAPGSEVLTVDSPEKARTLLKVAGLRGRTLLVFGDVPLFFTLYESYYRGAAPTPASWIEFSVFDNVVRRAFVVIPAADWQAFRDRSPSLRPLGEVPATPAPTRLFTASGIALVVVTPGCLPSLDEPALVYVDARRQDPAQVEALLTAHSIRSDVTVIFRPGAAP